jgi:uracil-DNA glycosylase family 4
VKDEKLKQLYAQCSTKMSEVTQEIYELLPGVGTHSPEIMFIIESPSQKEEETRRPFDEKSIHNFNVLLSDLELTKEDVFITYLVKYRPFKINERTGRIVNRAATEEEMIRFRPFIEKEIQILKPKLIIAFGNGPFRILTDQAQLSVSDHKGQGIEMSIKEQVYLVMGMFHPSQSSFFNALQDEKLALASRIKEIIGRSSVKQEPPIEPVETKEVETKEIETKEIESKEFETKEFESKEIRTTQPMEVIRRSANNTVGVSTLGANNTVGVSTLGANNTVGVSNSLIKKKIVMIYGGGGLVNDPCLPALERISSVLTELNISIKRVDLHKNAYGMDEILKEIGEAEGLIIGATVEWVGIGGRLQSFLDACWESSQHKVFSGLPLFGLVLAKQIGEREAYHHLLRSYEFLGGVEGISLCACIDNAADLEINNSYMGIIDKKAEDYYRIINQRRGSLPTSHHLMKVVKEINAKPTPNQRLKLSVEEASHEGRSQKKTIVSDVAGIKSYDEFIEKQHKDISDIASLFKNKILNKTKEVSLPYGERFVKAYIKGSQSEDMVIVWTVDERQQVGLVFKNGELKATGEPGKERHVTLASDQETIGNILEGKLSIQRGFMTGVVKAKGDFTVLYQMDKWFKF